MCEIVLFIVEKIYFESNRQKFSDNSLFRLNYFFPKNVPRSVIVNLNLENRLFNLNIFLLSLCLEIKISDFLNWKKMVFHDKHCHLLSKGAASWEYLR